MRENGDGSDGRNGKDGAGNERRVEGLVEGDIEGRKRTYTSLRFFEK